MIFQSISSVATWNDIQQFLASMWTTQQNTLISTVWFLCHVPFVSRSSCMLYAPLRPHQNQIDVSPSESTSHTDSLLLCVRATMSRPASPDVVYVNMAVVITFWLVSLLWLWLTSFCLDVGCLSWILLGTCTRQHYQVVTNCQSKSTHWTIHGVSQHLHCCSPGVSQVCFISG